MPVRTKKDRQQALRELLQENRRRLWQQIRGDIFDKLSEDYRAEFDRAKDSADLSVIDVLQTVGIRLVDIHQSELTEMAEAERKVNEGTYGTCERCGADISEQRLKAIPYATHCIRCAELLEESPVKGKGPSL